MRVEQKVNGVYQYLATQQTQTNSGTYELSFVPQWEDIRISVSGTSRYALHNLYLDRDQIDTLVTTYALSRGYRYGFNGMEKDDEVSGKGNSYTAEFWQYDSRLGRRWNIDPVVKHHESPYAAFANNPIYWKDPNGDDVINGNSKKTRYYQGKLESNSKKLEISKGEIHKYDGKNINDLVGRERKVYKGLIKESNRLEKEVSKYTSLVKEEEENSTITREVIREFRKRKIFDKWDSYSVNNKDVDIIVLVQSNQIEMTRENTQDVVGYTTEGVGALYDDDGYVKEIHVKLQIQRDKNGKVNIDNMTKDLIHGLGHFKDVKRVRRPEDIRSESEAINYEDEFYNLKE